MIRTAAIAAVLVLLFASPAAAWEPDPWTREQVVLEGIYAALLYVDWRQSVATLNLEETNPLLSRYPTEREFTEYFIASAAFHFAVSYVMPLNVRTRLQYITVGFQSAIVWNNWQLGITLGF